MADDLSVIKPKRGVYSDGTNGVAATPLPVVAAQNLATASALPTTTAQGTVQPGATLASASPLAPPVMPVAAPAAAAAAAQPVTPQGGASQIPGTPMPWNQAVAQEQARVNALPASSQISEGLNNLGTNALNIIGHNAQALPGAGPEINAAARGFTGFLAASRYARPGMATVDAPMAVANRSGGAAVAKPMVPGSPPPGTVPPVTPPTALPAPGAPVTPPSNLGAVAPVQPVVPGAPPIPALNAPAAAAQEAQAAQAAAQAAPNTAQATISAEEAAARAAQVRGAKVTAPPPVAPGAPATPAASTGFRADLANMSTAQKVILPTVAATAAGAAAYDAGKPDQAVPMDTTNAGGSITGGDPLAGGPYAQAATTYAQPDPSAIQGPSTLASANDVTRTGNSYTGGPNIAGNITINGKAPGGQMLGGSPTPEEAEAAHQRNLASLNSELAHEQWRATRVNPNDRPAGTTIIDASRTGGDDYKKFTEDANLNTARQSTGWTARGGNVVNKEALKSATDVIENRAKKEAANQTAANDLAKTRLTTQAENARAAATNAITMRGQDITATSSRENNRATTLASIYGTDVKNKAEMAKLDYQMRKDDKEFKRTEAKDGTETAEKEWKARNDAQDAVAKRAQSMRDPADKVGAARDAQAVMSHIEETKAQLEEVVKNNPNNKEAANQLDLFKRYGARNLDDKQIENLIRGSQLAEKVNKDIATGAKGVMGILHRMYAGTNTGVVSDVPFTGIKKVSRGAGFPDIYVETDSSGNPLGKDRKPLKAGSTDYGRAIPASVVEQDAGLFGLGLLTKPSANFSSITHR